LDVFALRDELDVSIPIEIRPDFFYNP